MMMTSIMPGKFGEILISFSKKDSRPSFASGVSYGSRVVSPTNSCCPTSPSSIKLKPNLASSLPWEICY